MKKMLLAIGFLVLTTIPAFAGKYLDSLYQAYNAAKSDTAKYDILIRIYAEHLDNYGDNYNPDSIVGLLDKTIDQLRVKNDLRRLESFLSLKGLYYYQKKKYDQAFQYYDTCRQIAERYSDYEELGNIYASIQLVYYYLKLKDRQVQSVYKSIGYYKKAGCLSCESNMLFSLGNLFRQDKQYDQAINSFLQAAEIGNTLKDSLSAGISYLFCALCAIETGKLSLAGEYIKKGKPVMHSPLIYQPFYYYKISGSWLKALGRNDEALHNLGIAADLALKGKQRYQRPSALSDMAEIYIGSKRFSKAKQLLEEAKTIAYDENMLPQKMYVSRVYAKYYEAIGQPGKALEEYKTFQALKDSANQGELSVALASSATEAAFSQRTAEMVEAQKKKEQEAAKKLNHQRTINYAIGAGLLLLGFHAFMLYRNYRKQKKAHALLKATQSQLIQSEKMAFLGELTAGIAHEIQNPLNFINNFSELNDQLADEMKDELIRGNSEEAISIAEDMKQNMQKICQHGRRADSIVKRMVQHSRACTGQKELTNINALADEFLKLTYYGLKAQDDKFNVQFETIFDKNLSSGDGKIKIVPQGIGMVIKNLLSNAFYAVSEKQKLDIPGYVPKVSVITKRNGKAAEIIVKDNGSGIPKKTLDKIFQPFFSTKPAGQGTGLGLSLSYDMVTKVHGGKLDVETKEGEYSEFIVHLPV